MTEKLTNEEKSMLRKSFRYSLGTNMASSKKWLSKPALDEDGNPILQKNGKPVLRKSYSVLQDDFFNHMRDAGYTDIERGERGSSEEHLTVTQFKVMQEKRRLEGLTEQIEQSGTELAEVQQQISTGNEALQRIESDTHKAQRAAAAAEKKLTGAEQALNSQALAFSDIEKMGKKNLTGNIVFTPNEARELKALAKKGVTADARVAQAESKLARAMQDAGIWKRRYETLKEQTQPYLDAVKLAPERVADFLKRIVREAVIPQEAAKTKQRNMER